MNPGSLSFANLILRGAAISVGIRTLSMLTRVQIQARHSPKRKVGCESSEASAISPEFGCRSHSNRKFRRRLATSIARATCFAFSSSCFMPGGRYCSTVLEPGRPAQRASKHILQTFSANTGMRASVYPNVPACSQQSLPKHVICGTPRRLPNSRCARQARYTDLIDLPQCIYSSVSVIFRGVPVHGFFTGILGHSRVYLVIHGYFTGISRFHIATISEKKQEIQYSTWARPHFAN